MSPYDLSSSTIYVGAYNGQPYALPNLLPATHSALGQLLLSLPSAGQGTPFYLSPPRDSSVSTTSTSLVVAQDPRNYPGNTMGLPCDEVRRSCLNPLQPISDLAYGAQDCMTCGNPALNLAGQLLPVVDEPLRLPPRLLLPGNGALEHVVGPQTLEAQRPTTPYTPTDARLVVVSALLLMLLCVLLLATGVAVYRRRFPTPGLLATADTLGEGGAAGVGVGRAAATAPQLHRDSTSSGGDGKKAKSRSKRRGDRKGLRDEKDTEPETQGTDDPLGGSGKKKGHTHSVSAAAVLDGSRGILRLGRLQVDINKVLGYGSSGTVVFEGKLQGRRVAVKRMLVDFYDAVEKEIGVLLAADEHPNVVRYYATEKVTLPQGMDRPLSRVDRPV